MQPISNPALLSLLTFLLTSLPSSASPLSTFTKDPLSPRQLGAKNPISITYCNSIIDHPKADPNNLHPNCGGSCAQVELTQANPAAAAPNAACWYYTSAASPSGSSNMGQQQSGSSAGTMGAMDPTASPSAQSQSLGSGAQSQSTGSGAGLAGSQGLSSSGDDGLDGAGLDDGTSLGDGTGSDGGSSDDESDDDSLDNDVLKRGSPNPTIKFCNGNGMSGKCHFDTECELLDDGSCQAKGTNSIGLVRE